MNLHTNNLTGDKQFSVSKTFQILSKAFDINDADLIKATQF